MLPKLRLQRQGTNDLLNDFFGDEEMSLL